MDINLVKSIINTPIEGDESIIMNDEGDIVEKQRSSAARKAAKVKEMKKELGLYDKYEEENEMKREKQSFYNESHGKANVDGNECIGSSFSSAIGGAQTCVPIGKVKVNNLKSIKEYLNGGSSKI